MGPDGAANLSLAKIDHDEIENLTASAATLVSVSHRSIVNTPI